VVDSLVSKYKALSSNPSVAKIKGWGGVCWSWAQQFISVILAIWEAEIRRMVV
jgi:hypothetical protein